MLFHKRLIYAKSLMLTTLQSHFGMTSERISISTQCKREKSRYTESLFSIFVSVHIIIHIYVDISFVSYLSYSMRNLIVVCIYVILLVCTTVRDLVSTVRVNCMSSYCFLYLLRLYAFSTSTLTHTYTNKHTTKLQCRNDKHAFIRIRRREWWNVLGGSEWKISTSIFCNMFKIQFSVKNFP